MCSPLALRASDDGLADKTEDGQEIATQRRGRSDLVARLQ
jgi:hypothetical protein